MDAQKFAYNCKCQIEILEIAIVEKIICAPAKFNLAPASPISGGHDALALTARCRRW